MFVDHRIIRSSDHPHISSVQWFNAHISHSSPSLSQAWLSISCEREQSAGENRDATLKKSAIHVCHCMCVSSMLLLDLCFTLMFGFFINMNSKEIELCQQNKSKHSGAPQVADPEKYPRSAKNFQNHQIR